MLRIALFGLLAFTFAAPVSADTRADLQKSFSKLTTAKAYRATMTELPSGRTMSVIEFQAPDRYRITVAGQAPNTIIGDTMYMRAGGQMMKIPMPKDTLGKFRNQTAMEGLAKAGQMSELAPTVIGGQAARKVRFTTVGKDAATSTVWIGVRSGHVLQVETSGKAAGKPYAMRIVYSDLDSPAIKINTPG